MCIFRDVKQSQRTHTSEQYSALLTFSNRIMYHSVLLVFKCASI